MRTIARLFWWCFVILVSAFYCNHGRVGQTVHAMIIRKRGNHLSTNQNENLLTGHAETERNTATASTTGEVDPTGSTAFDNLINAAEESENKDKLSELPPDIQSKIADIIFKSSGKDVLKLKQTNKYWNTFLHNINYSKYSIIGSERKLANDDNLCEQLENKPNENLYKHVRKMRITKRLWNQCGFLENKELFNLEELTINVHDKVYDSHYSDRFVEDDGGQEMIQLWKDIIEKEHFPSLKSLEIKNDFGEGVLHVLLLSENIPNIDRLKEAEEALQTKLLSVNDLDAYKSTPLHYCLAPDVFRVRKGTFFDTMDCVQLFLKHGADPNVMNINYFSPVHYASTLLQASPLELLLKYGGDMNLQRDMFDGFLTQTPLFMALQNYKLEGGIVFSRVSQRQRFRSLIDRSSVMEWVHDFHQIDIKSQHPFYFLLQKGADLSIRIGRFGTVLAEAIDHSQGDIVSDIIDSKYFTLDLLNVPTNDKKDSVLMICFGYLPDVFLRLLERELDLSYRNSQGQNILLYGSQSGVLKMDSLKKLLDSGVNINSVDHDGNSILNYHIDYFFSDSQVPLTVSQRDLLEMVNFASENGLNLHHRNKKKHSNILLMLGIVLKTVEHDKDDKLAETLLKSIVNNIRFKEIFAKKAEFTKEDIEQNILDAHLLLLAVYKTGNQGLIQKLRENLPDEILGHFESPYVNDSRLIYSKKFIYDYQYLMSNYDHNLWHYRALSLLNKFSKQSQELIKSVRITYTDYLTYNLAHLKHLESVIIEDFASSNLKVDINYFDQVASTNENLKEFKIYDLLGDSLIAYALKKDLDSGNKYFLDMISDKLFEFMKDEAVPKGQSALHHCVLSSQDFDWCIPELLRRGMNPNIKNENGITPLQLAIMENKLSIVMKLLKVDNIDLTVRVPIKSQKDVLLPRYLGASLLHLPAFIDDRSSRLQLTRLLLDHGASIHDVDAFGKTALRYAVLNEDTEIIEMLLEKDPKAIFRTGIDGHTPLMDAVKIDNYDILSLLLNHSERQSSKKEHQEFMNQKNAFGMTVRDYVVCIDSTQRKISELLEITDFECNVPDFNPDALKISKDRNIFYYGFFISRLSISDPLILWNYICLLDIHKFRQDRVNAMVKDIFFVNQEKAEKTLDKVYQILKKKL